MTSNHKPTRFSFGSAGGTSHGAGETAGRPVPAAEAVGADGARGVWARVRVSLRTRFDDTTYTNWISGLEFVAEVNGEVLVSAPGELERDRVCSVHGHAIQQAWKAADPSGRPLRIEARTLISPDILALSAVADRACQATPAEALAAPEAGLDAEASSVADAAAPRLDDYVVGDSNRVAYTLARRIAAGEGPAQVVALIGPHGVGKSMLLRGIQTAVDAAHGPGAALYVSAEDFLVAFVDGVRRKDTSDLRTMMRSARVVLMDDFHFICSKPGTLGEFFTHLRANVSKGRTVVIATDQPLTQLEQLDSRMRDELMGGVVANIDLPDRALRLQILKAAVRVQAEADPAFDMPEAWLEMIADRSPVSGRVLNGVISGVYFATTGADLPLTWAAVEEQIRVKVSPASARMPKFDTIKDVTAKMYNVSKQDLESECRKRVFALPRQYAMYMCRKLTTGSFPQIGRHFGDRDHTTVLFAYRKVARLSAADQAFADEMRQLEQRILQDPRNQR